MRGGMRGGRRGGGGMPGGGRIRGGHSVPKTGIYGLNKSKLMGGKGQDRVSGDVTDSSLRRGRSGFSLDIPFTGYRSGKGQDRMRVPHGTGSFRDVMDGEASPDGVTRDWTNIRTPAGFQTSAVSADQQFLQRQFTRAQRQQAQSQQTRNQQKAFETLTAAPQRAQAPHGPAGVILDPSSLTSSQFEQAATVGVRRYDPPTPYTSRPSPQNEILRGYARGYTRGPSTTTGTIVAPSTPSVSGSLRVPKVKRPGRGKRWPTPQAEMWGILGVDANAPALDLMDMDEAAQVDPETPRTAFAVLLRGPYVLLLRRSKKDRWQPGKWSLPGGHVNGPETLQDGVAREVLEEAGLAIATPLFHPLISFTNKRGKFVSFFAAHAPSTPVCRHDNEHDLFAWVHPEDLWKYPLAPNVMTAIGFALGINPKLLMKRQRANQKQRRAIWRKVRV